MFNILYQRNKPWWHKYGASDLHMGETTPPPDEEFVPEDNFPKVFSMTSNSYTKRGLNKSTSNLSKSKSSLNSEEEENKPPAPKKEKDESYDTSGDRNREKENKSNAPKPTQDGIKATKMNDSMPNLVTNNVPLDELSKSESDLRTKDTSSTIGTKTNSDEVFNKEQNIPNDTKQEHDGNGDVPASQKDTTPVTNKQPESMTTDDSEKEKEKEEITTKTKGARRDLGSVAEKLINKNKIKKIKSKRMGRAKSMPPTKTAEEENVKSEEHHPATKTAEEENVKSEEHHSNNDEIQREPEQEKSEPKDAKSDIQVPSMDANDIPKEHDDSENKGCSSRKLSNTSRKRHLDASNGNLAEEKTSLGDISRGDADSVASSDVISEPTAKTKSSSNGGGQQMILLFNQVSTDVRLIQFSKHLFITFTIVCFSLIILYYRNIIKDIIMIYTSAFSQ